MFNWDSPGVIQPEATCTNYNHCLLQYAKSPTALASYPPHQVPGYEATTAQNDYSHFYEHDDRYCLDLKLYTSRSRFIVWFIIRQVFSPVSFQFQLTGLAIRKRRKAGRGLGTRLACKPVHGANHGDTILHPGSTVRCCTTPPTSRRHNQTSQLRRTWTWFARAIDAECERPQLFTMKQPAAVLTWC